MQPLPAKKKAYNIEEFLSLNRANPIISDFGPKKTSYLTCVCHKPDQQGLTCFKCHTLVHSCIAPKPNRGELFECASCLSRALDPLVQVRKVLVQSHFKTYCIFDYCNLVNFEFFLAPEDLAFPVEVRGLLPEGTTLGWPMQGSFFLNE